MWPTLICLWLTLSGTVPRRPVPHRRPAFRRPSSRPRLEVLEDRCVPSAGFLDPTFNTTGVVITPDAPATAGFASAVAVYPSGTANAGKIVSVGRAGGSTNIGLVRYNPDGSLDATFGNGGIVTQHLTGTGLFDSANAVALVGDKVLVSGYADLNKEARSDFEIARFNSDGSLDQTFGSNGFTLTPFGDKRGDFAGADAMAVQADGKIVVAGTAEVFVQQQLYNELAVARYTPNGALDTTFGNNGQLTIGVGSLDAVVGGQALSLSGSSIDLVDQGQSGGNVYVTQLTATGQLDPTFGAGGVVNLAPANQGSNGSQPCLTVQPDGKLVAVCYSNSSSPAGIHVTRLLANGTPDTGFGTGGTATVPWSTTGTFYSSAVQVDPLGRFVIGGYRPSYTYNNFTVIRLTPTGALDSTFGVGGVGTSGSLLSLNGDAVAMTLQPDGKAVLVGRTNDYKNAVVRFDGDSPTLTANPNPVTAGTSLTLTASNFEDFTAGASITQVTFYYYNGTGTKVTLGTVTVSSSGAWTLNSKNAFGLLAGTYTIYAQADDTYGIFGDPFAITLTVQ
jgi:uncharacterized delta-60 repeat protein